MSAIWINCTSYCVIAANNRLHNSAIEELSPFDTVSHL